MRKFLTMLLLVMLASPAFAQQSRTFGPQTLDVDEEKLELNDQARGLAVVYIQAVGTFVANIQWECSNDGGTTFHQVDVTPVSSQTPQTYITAAGTFSALVSGRDCQVRVNDYTSGSAAVNVLGLFVGGGGAAGGSTEITGSALSAMESTATSAAALAATIAGGLVKVDIRAANGSTLVVDPCQGQTKQRFSVSVASGTLAELIDGEASKTIYICNILVVSSAAQTVTILSGTDNACGGGTSGMFGGATDTTGTALAANGGFAAGNGGYAIAWTNAVADDVCYDNSSASQVTISGTYVKQ